MQRKQGFTLVELVIVIAILGLIAVVGLRQYGTVRQKQAQKMNSIYIWDKTGAKQRKDNGGIADLLARKGIRT